MKIDLSGLVNKAKDELEESSSSSNNNNGPRIVYPGIGTLTIKLLYNIKMQGVQRMIIRHDTGKNKVACLSMYDQDCPICQSIANVIEMKGDECGVKAHRYAKRGISYAQIVDMSDGYFNGSKNPPKKGDVVLMMYPPSVYEEINSIIVRANINVNKLVCENTGKAITIDKTQKGGGYPSYSISVDGFNEYTSCYDENNEHPDDEAFDKMLEDLPDLGEAILPRYLSDKVLRDSQAFSETLVSKYISSNVVNPGDETPNNNVNNTSPNKAENISDLPFDMSINYTETLGVNDLGNDGIPKNAPHECWGQYNGGDKKCIICSFDTQCEAASNK